MMEESYMEYYTVCQRCSTTERTFWLAIFRGFRDAKTYAQELALETDRDDVVYYITHQGKLIYNTVCGVMRCTL